MTAQSLVGLEPGDYVLDQLRGEGGMGAVYLATHRHMGLRFAVKVLHRQAGAVDPAWRDRFFLEARQGAGELAYRGRSAADTLRQLVASPGPVGLVGLVGQFAGNCNQNVPTAIGTNCRTMGHVAAAALSEYLVARQQCGNQVLERCVLFGQLRNPLRDHARWVGVHQ